MAASCTLLTAKPSSGASHAPAQLGGDTAEASCYFGSPRRLVADVLGSNNATVTLYRYSAALADWVALGSGQSITANVAAQTAWSTHGIDGYYAMVVSAGTGTWQPIPAIEGP